MAQSRNKLNEATAGANSFDRSLGSVSGAAGKANSGFSAMSAFLGNLAANALMMVASKTKDVVAGFIQAGVKFEATMSKVQAVSGASASDMVELSNKAQELGKSTKFTASEVGDAFTYMALAGWKPHAMLAGIKGVLDLAAASGADLARTSDIVTDALTAMGYAASDAGRLADVMAAASASANTDVDLMGETFKYVAPIAGALKMSMEDVAIAIGVMASAGVKGSQAGTALRSMLTRLAAPTSEVQAAMDKIGFQFTDTAGKTKPLSQVMDELRAKISQCSEAEKSEIATAIAGTHAVSGMLAIIDAAPEDYENLTKAIRESDGAAARMAETMMNRPRTLVTSVMS